MSDRLKLSKMDDWSFDECKAVYNSLVSNWYDYKSDLVDEVLECEDRDNLCKCIAYFACKA